MTTKTLSQNIRIIFTPEEIESIKKVIELGKKIVALDEDNSIEEIHLAEKDFDLLETLDEISSDITSYGYEYDNE